MKYMYEVVAFGVDPGGGHDLGYFVMGRFDKKKDALDYISKVEKNKAWDKDHHRIQIFTYNHPWCAEGDLMTRKLAFLKEGVEAWG